MSEQNTMSGIADTPRESAPEMQAVMDTNGRALDEMRRTNRSFSSRPDGRLLLERGVFGERCFVDCPAVGYRREVAAIEYKDGGRLEFPADFSAGADPEEIRKCSPKGAAGAG